MSLSLVHSRALVGLQAPAVTVEVHLANGLPSFTLVGLADVEVKEARERVRSALQNSGLDFPHNQRITVNLAPADLPKDSGRLDLPMALGMLAADAVSFVFGFGWLMVVANMILASGGALPAWLASGDLLVVAWKGAVEPFIVWDALKMVFAALTVAGALSLVRRTIR